MLMYCNVILMSMIVGPILQRFIIKLPKNISNEYQPIHRHPLPCYFTFLITIFISVLTVRHFGITWLSIIALGFSWILVTLAIIDWNTLLLPDELTLPGMWLGLLINVHSTFTDLNSAVIGASAGYLILWSIFWLYKFMTGKEGLGYGDFKLLAMLGSFLGWQVLPAIIFMASLSATIVATFLIVNKRLSYTQPLPFGPFLAVAGWISLIGNDKICLLYKAVLLS